MMKTDVNKDFLPRISLFSEGKKMSIEDERDPAVVIKPVAGRKGEYLAYCRSHFLDATFSVCFKDTLMAALALHEFLEMIRRKYEEKQVRTLLSEEEIRFKSDALLDVLSSGSEKEKAVSRGSRAWRHRPTASLPWGSWRLLSAGPRVTGRNPEGGH